MKKVTFALMSLAMIVSIALSSCSKDDDETPLTISQTTLTMAHGDTLSITANQKSTFTSADPFVATVTADGKIEAKHVGQTVVTATADSHVQRTVQGLHRNGKTCVQPLQRANPRLRPHQGRNQGTGNSPA